MIDDDDVAPTVEDGQVIGGCRPDDAPTDDDDSSSLWHAVGPWWKAAACSWLPVTGASDWWHRRVWCLNPAGASRETAWPR